jgi:ABC-type sulfate/molybdate transport systems ATPase subunit
VIFGPSGAGKSTLLRILAGLDRSRPGEQVNARIEFRERLLTGTAQGLGIAPGQRASAFVTQQSALFPHLSVKENVAFGLRHLDRAAREERIRAMLALVDAQDLGVRRVQHLSGGQAQRVALARALARTPQLLLLDEPFSALDGTASDALLARLQEWLRAHNVQTVLATHDVTDALATEAEVLLLREGRQIALGPAREVLAAERSRMLARLESS